MLSTKVWYLNWFLSKLKGHTGTHISVQKLSFSAFVLRNIIKTLMVLISSTSRGRLDTCRPYVVCRIFCHASGGACFPPRWCELLVGRPLTVASLGFLSPGAATDSVTLFFEKSDDLDLFSLIALWKVLTPTFFSALGVHVHGRVCFK